MATPTQNAVPVTSYWAYNYGTVATMLSGAKWGGAVGTGVTLTYSFPGQTAYWISVYSSYQEYTDYTAMNQAHQAASVLAMAAWSLVSNVGFVATSDTSTNVGEIRLAFSDYIGVGYAAQAYTPGSPPRAGDVWIDTDYYNYGAAKGGFLYFTILHELGHALGLNHSFNLPSGKDNFFNSVMSYTASPWTSGNYASYYPTTPMFYDILAMQTLYGLDVSANTGHTNYAFTGGPYFQTIYDSGGIDTITYSGSDSCIIRLKIGHYSAVSSSISFSNGYSSRETVCIGPSTVIENATGGIRNDTLEGNDVANVLFGNMGYDSLRGFLGNDRLIGGLGRDLLRGDAGTDYFDFNSVAEIGKLAGARDIILDFSMVDDYIDLISIDANSTTPAINEAFGAIIAGTTFDGVKGALRYFLFNSAINANDRTYVIGDVNGDRVSDFQIELVGLFNLRPFDILE